MPSQRRRRNQPGLRAPEVWKAPVSRETPSLRRRWQRRTALHREMLIQHDSYDSAASNPLLSGEAPPVLH